MRYFDTHTHEPIIRPNVTSIYNLRIDHSLSELPAEGYFSVGIHPEDACRADQSALECVELIAQNARCVAIGETGIDHRYAELEVQKKIFALHCQIAQKVQKPLIIHCVRSQSEILQISRSVEVPRIFHSYSRENEQLQRAAGIFYSLSPRNIARSAQIAPDQILTETDDSQTPIEDLYAQLAATRKMSVEALAEVVERNFFRIFAL